MTRIKTKLFQDGTLACDKRVDEKINNFIEEHNIKINDIVDVKLSSNNDRIIALLIYREVLEDEHK